MYRVRSTDVWYNMPGVVAAYQPVACPGGPLLARVNVSNEQRTPTRYMATPGVAPAHDPRTGWTFDRTASQYLSTRFSSVLAPTCLIAFNAADTAGDVSILFGANTTYELSYDFWGGRRYMRGGAAFIGGGAVTSGVIGFSGATAYLNGAIDATMGAGSVTGGIIVIGARSPAELHGTFQCQAFILLARVLSPAEVRVASRQMAYCDRNPDWSAWGRRRRYYYAPSAAAGLAFSPVGSGVIGSSVVRRIAA